jgi:hypothetical protein
VSGGGGGGGLGVACSNESMGMVVGEVLRSSHMAIVCWMKEEL